MNNALDEDWRVLTGLFPVGWQQAAKDCGAMERMRGFSSPETLLRTLLLHVGNGYSLRETVVRAKLADWADVSDVALLKRLRSSESWLRQLCVKLLQETSGPPHTLTPQLRVIDGTVVKEPGKTGSQWRIHYALRLPGLECDFLEVTSTAGAGTGESFQRLPARPGELILADAAYCRMPGLAAAMRSGADVLVRVNPSSVRIFGPGKRRFPVLQRLARLTRAGETGDWQVRLWADEDAEFTGRLCALRKSEQAIGQAHRRLRRKSVKKQTQLRPETLEYAKYILVFTSYSEGSAAQVLEWYRMRWQIELVFKRLKSLAQLGHLPKSDDSSARAWLYGKLLVALLTQKLIRTSRDISPWGYGLSEPATKPVA